jgi:hypothetical protein
LASAALIAASLALALNNVARPHASHSRQQAIQAVAKHFGGLLSDRTSAKLIHRSDLRHARLFCSSMENPGELVWVVAISGRHVAYSCGQGSSGCGDELYNWDLAVLPDGSQTLDVGMWTSGIDPGRWPPFFDSLPDLSAPFGGLF